MDADAGDSAVAVVAHDAAGPAAEEAQPTTSPFLARLALEAAAAAPAARPIPTAQPRREHDSFLLEEPELLLRGLGLEAVRRRGREVIARCPFHSPDTTPSFSLNAVLPGHPAQCFGCGWRGNAITLVRELEGVTGSQARARLSEYGAPVPTPRAKRRRRRPDNWRRAGRPRGHARARRIFQRRLVARLLREGARPRAEVVRVLRERLGLRQSAAYRLLAILVAEGRLEARGSLLALPSESCRSSQAPEVLDGREVPRARTRVRASSQLSLSKEIGNDTVTRLPAEIGNDTLRACEECSGPLPEGSRSTRRYCSEACKQRAKRQRADQPSPAESPTNRMSLTEYVNRRFGRETDEERQLRERRARAALEDARPWQERGLDDAHPWSRLVM